MFSKIKNFFRLKNEVANTPPKLLNIGSGPTRETLHVYADHEVVNLDIDPDCDPDILCDARDLIRSRPDLAGRFDVVYCSHNLEHYDRNEVPEVLAGFLHVLKPGGFAHIRVPDIESVMNDGYELGDVVYESKAGPIRVIDMLYGLYTGEFMAHKTGFSFQTLAVALLHAGFEKVYPVEEKVADKLGFEVEVIARRD